MQHPPEIWNILREPKSSFLCAKQCGSGSSSDSGSVYERWHPQLQDRWQHWQLPGGSTEHSCFPPLTHSAGRSLRLHVIYSSYVLSDTCPKISRDRMVMSSHKKQDVFPALPAQIWHRHVAAYSEHFSGWKSSPWGAPDISFLMHECILSKNLYFLLLSCNSNCE